MSTHRPVIKSATIIGFATLCSRILGFIRDVVIARLFGVYVYAQAFVVAFRIPNLFRDFLGEGAANAALVPIFSEYLHKKKKEEFWELVNVVLNLLLVILSAIVILGIIFSPVIVRLLAPGFIADPYKLAVTIKLNQLIFPYCLLACLAAYGMAILNSLRHFAIPAFGPCLLNICIIIFALIFGEGVKGLASGILIGGVLQLVIQIPILRRKGFRLSLFKKFDHPALGEIRRLMLPRVLSSSIYQLNNFVDSIFGSLSMIVGEGGVASLYFAYRLILFPLGIFSNSLSQALLPTFSTHVLEDSLDKLRHSLSFGLRATFFVILPASAAFVALSFPIIASIFLGGKFDAYAATTTARILVFYSLGLLSYAVTRILQSCFFALKDTVTPSKVSFLTLVLNIVFNVILMFPMKLSGVALATSLSGIITSVILFRLLFIKISPWDVGPVYSSFFKILLASICMGFVSYFASLKINYLVGSHILRFLNLGLIILIGLAAYVGFCFLFRVEEMSELWAKIVKSKILKVKT